MRVITDRTDPALVRRLINETTPEPIDVTLANDSTLVMVARRVLEASIDRPVLIRGKPFTPDLARRISDIERRSYIERVTRRHRQMREARAQPEPTCPRCEKPFDPARPHYYAFTRKGTKVRVEVWTCTGQSFYTKVVEPNPRGPRNYESDMHRAKLRMQAVARRRQRQREVAQRKAQRDYELRQRRLASVKRVRLIMKPLPVHSSSSEEEESSERDSSSESDSEINPFFIEAVRRQEGLEKQRGPAHLGKSLASGGVGDADDGAPRFLDDEVGDDAVPDSDDSRSDDGEFDE
jgi:hypothetical protein